MLRKENVAEAKKYLEKIVKEKEIPGCSVLIVDKKGGKASISTAVSPT